MKFLFSALLAAILLVQNTFSASAEGLQQQLSNISKVSKVEKLESSQFSEKYLLLFDQPIDHNNPSLGSFKQRVFVCNVHPDSATVVVTEGYGAQYAMRAGYREELSGIFNTNIVVIEHRYFLESCPEGCDWKYLNAENAANDHHNVVTALKSVYKGKWIATGISKGGQTAAAFRTFFPDDVDITIPYVGPLCKGVEDGRHEPFLDNYVGTADERAAIKEFQIEVLKRKNSIMPLLQQMVESNQYNFSIPLAEVYDYCVLEFPFALWQWGTSLNVLPKEGASDKEYFDCLVRISGPDYWVNETTISPFFVQAAKELGYYGYDTKPFKDLLTIKSAKGYLQKIFLPKGEKFKFDKTLYKKMSKFISTTDSRMLFIYGQYDPWSAVKVEDPHRDNIKIFIDPEGSHRARIGTFPKETQKEIITILAQWLYN